MRFSSSKVFSPSSDSHSRPFESQARPCTLRWPRLYTRGADGNGLPGAPCPVGVTRRILPFSELRSCARLLFLAWIGSPPPPELAVFTVISGLKADALPLASLARTLNVCVELAASPSAVAVRSGTVANTAPSMATSYAATPVSSVDASQVSDTLVASTWVVCRFAGTDGGVLSSLFGVVMSSALLACEVFPAPSRAATVMTYRVFGVRFFTVTDSTLPPTSASTLPPLNTWYEATPTLSIEASQASDTVVGVGSAVRCRLPGGVGGSGST